MGRWLHFDSRYFAEGINSGISPTFELLDVLAERHPLREEVDQGLGVQDGCQELLHRDVPLDLGLGGERVPVFIRRLKIDALLLINKLSLIFSL